MKVILTAIFCWLLTLSAFPQNREVDSLEKWLTNAVEDTVKMNVLNTLAYDYAFTDPIRGLHYADQAIALGEKLNHYKLGTSFNYKALNYTSLGNDTLAITWYNKAIDFARSHGNKQSEGKALNNLAILYTNRAEYKKAFELRFNALAIFQELHDQKAVGDMYNNLGVTYLYLADYPEALSYYFKAIASAQGLNDPQGQAKALMNIGLVYKKLGNYANTFTYYQKALLLFRQLGDEHQLADILANMASAYDERGDHEKALTLFNQALAINRKNRLKREQGSNLADIGIVYHNMGQYRRSYQSFQAALELYKDSPDNNSLAVVYNELADMLLSGPDSSIRSLGINAGSRYAEAEKYAINAIRISKESESTEREMAGWQILSGIHEQQKKYDQALKDYKNYTVLKDSIFNDEKKLAIKKAEMQFEADKKETLATAAIQKEKIIKNALAAGCVIVVITSIALFASYKKRRDALQAQKELVYVSKATETEMKVLRLQMNPHFIFNSLNAIGNYIGKNDLRAADYFLSEFAGLMRGILENAEEREITLASELKMSGQYLQLEAARLNHKFTYAIRTADDINPAETWVPPLILQPFIENSIWHGIAQKEGSGHISLEVRRNGNLLELSVTDDGVGRNHRQSTGKKSFGVRITADRLALLHGGNDASIGVSITDLEKGTRVEIKIPYKTDIA
jgi:tetratricopeptide (TPR) repeat protein